MIVEICKTEDNTFTLYSREYNDYYHSLSGALLETTHIYINHCLKKLLTRKKDLRILDIGFGTGLNALCSYAISTEQNLNIAYFAIEPYPLSHEIVQKLNYTSIHNLRSYTDAFTLMHKHRKSTLINISSNFWFSFIKSKIEEVSLPTCFFDGVYFDLFKPTSMPQCWSVEVFTKIYKSLNINGILVTFSCKGWVRQNLNKAGFEIKKIKGIGQKKEFTFATRKKHCSDET